jgi:single-strand DNA-binding protein
MANLNKVMLIGNLTRDPELRFTPKGTAVADVAIAINRIWNNEAGQRQEETTFVDITLWGRQAELAQQYLTKGRGIYVEGRLQMDTWDDKATGQKRSKLKVIGENLQFLPDGRSTPGRSPQPGESGAPRNGGMPNGGMPTHGGSAAPEGEYPEEDEIPF